MKKHNQSASRDFAARYHLRLAGILFGLVGVLAASCTSPSDPIPVASPVPPAPAAPAVPRQVPGLPGISGNFVLRTVNDHQLPVKCPYGTGEWDYDDDAGSWELTESSFLMNVDGTYTNTLSDQARSGATTSQTFTGTYTRTSESTFEIHANGGTTFATISGGRLIWDWGNGTVLAFEAKSP